MSMKPQTDPHSPQISAETERAIRNFVRAAVERLAEIMKNQTPEWEVDLEWKRDTNGNFFGHTRRAPMLWPYFLSDAWLRSLPDYDICIGYLKSDMVIGPHLDHIVGTNAGGSSLNADSIMRSTISAMLNEEGVFVFTDERFDQQWRELVEFFCADRFACKLVAPLPYLTIPEFPLRLNSELVLDRLTDAEVKQCYLVGVLQPQWPPFPLIPADIAVGIRWTMYLPKVIRTEDEAREPLDAPEEGRFGNRPLGQEHLVVDDVLSALRLFKHSQVNTTGCASWTDYLWFNSGPQYRVLRQWPFSGKYELSAGEVPQFLEFWHLLEEGAARFDFSIHRFNLAFDRTLRADRIVDLVIAAESLLLRDLPVDHGEIRFRFALRAAKFIEHPTFGEHDVYRLMRQAYDVRSAIVHGGSPDDTRLPDNPSANLSTFIDVIEKLVRLGLRKALSMKEDGKKLRQAEYWDSLVFSKSNQ
jgi:hypothetical protein